MEVKIHVVLNVYIFSTFKTCLTAPFGQLSPVALNRLLKHY
jgi:hypothetical protein